MLDFLVDYALPISLAFCAFMGALFAIYYKVKRGIEIATENKEAINRMAEKHDSLEDRVLIIEEFDKSIDRRQEKHEAGCEAFKKDLSNLIRSEFQRVYDKMELK